MFEIDQIPSAVLERIEQKGFSRESLCIGAFCDRDRNHLPAQIYLFATKDQLLRLEGAMAVQESSYKPVRGISLQKKSFVELSFESYPLSSLHRFRVEELLSTGRLTA